MFEIYCSLRKGFKYMSNVNKCSWNLIFGIKNELWRPTASLVEHKTNNSVQ